MSFIFKLSYVFLIVSLVSHSLIMNLLCIFLWQSKKSAIFEMGMGNRIATVLIYVSWFNCLSGRQWLARKMAWEWQKIAVEYVNSNCLRKPVKKAGKSPIRKKIGTTCNFLQVLGMFLARFGPGVSWTCAITIFKFHMFQSRYRSPRSPYPAERETHAGSGNEIAHVHLRTFHWHSGKNTKKKQCFTKYNP